nr:hypothetical protein [Vibrio ostreicida]
MKLLILTITIGIGFFASDLYHWGVGRSKSKSLADYCLLTTQPCQIDQVRITVDRDISQPLIATEVTVEWPDAQGENLTLLLQGYEMEMGTTVFQLNKSDPDLFTGKIILPICTTDAMTWVGFITDGTQNVHTSIRMEQ